MGDFKPEPGLFLHAAQVCGAPPEACVVIEDSDTGIRAAKNARMRVLAYDPTDANAFEEEVERFQSMATLPTLLG